MKISRQNSNRIQIDAVSLFTRQMKPHRFENAPLLAAVSNRHGFGNSLDRCRVNGRCSRIENDAVTNETENEKHLKTKDSCSKFPRNDSLLEFLLI